LLLKQLGFGVMHITDSVEGSGRAVTVCCAVGAVAAAEVVARVVI